MNFIPELTKLDFKKSNVKHPEIPTDGRCNLTYFISSLMSKLVMIILMVMNGLSLNFFFHINKLPDNLRGTDYFTTIICRRRKKFLASS